MDVEFDQHFMENDYVIEEIVNSSNINSDDIVFEIGPGKGALTKKILERKPSKLISVELDSRLKPFLDEINSDKFELVFGNGLEEIENFKFTKLIANIPYAITEPLYKKILDNQYDFVLMLHGLDFYKNIVSRETRWNYFVNAFYDVSLVREVSGAEFTPTTKVKSAIVKLELKEDIDQYDSFLQNLWKKRSRNTLNCLVYSLVDSYSMTKKEAKEKVMNLDLREKDLVNKFELISNEVMNKILNRI